MRLWLKIIIALVLGTLVGYLLGPDLNWASEKNALLITSFLSIPGQIFLSLIQLVVIPLVFASVILGIVGGESLDKLKSLGVKIGIYFLFTTIVSVFIGFFVAAWIKPGTWIDSSKLTGSNFIMDFVKPTSPSGSWVSNFIPNNLIRVLADGEMLQVVILAIFLGIALMKLNNDEAKPLISLLNTFQKLSMVVIGWAMKLAPLAVFGLSSQLLVKLGTSVVLGLSGYIATVILGLLLLLGFYLTIVSVAGKMKPLYFLSQLRELQLLAFSTSSSASVMPLSIETAEKKLKIPPQISQFIIPLGTTINMDGTALYQGVATLFLAQVFGIDLSFGQMLLVVGTATLSSIGAPGTPGVGMAVLASILQGVGIPTSGIFLIMGVDRLLDMCRTVLNVTGDITASVVMSSLDSKQPSRG